MGKGILYGVSVGPGDPSHLTLGALQTIEKCSIVAAPRTKDGNMVALDIVKKATDLKGKEIVPLDFSMSMDKQVRDRCHKNAADKICEYLDNGKSVAMLNLGDVSIYASYQYLADIVKPMGYETVMISGVPSFCASAAVLNISLTEMGEMVHIIPGGGENDLEGIRGTKIWMKSGKALGALLEKMRFQGRQAFVVQNCGMENQRVYNSIDDEISNAYFSLVIEKEKK